MIELTRLNGSPLFLNSDLIKYVEPSPDTMIALLNGEKIVVLESCAEVVDRVTDFRRRLLSGLDFTGAASALSQPSPSVASPASFENGRPASGGNADVDSAALRRRRLQL